MINYFGQYFQLALLAEQAQTSNTHVRFRSFGIVIIAWIA